MAAYFYVSFIPQPAAGKDSRALHLELFTVTSALATFCEVINKYKIMKSLSTRLLPKGRKMTGKQEEGSPPQGY
jgi:hypothetical protein